MPTKGGLPVDGHDGVTLANEGSVNASPTDEAGIKSADLPLPDKAAARSSSAAPPSGAAPIPAIAGSTSFLLPNDEAKMPMAKYTVSMIDAPVREVLFALARDAELNLDIHPGIDDKITINAVQQTLPAILDRIVEQTNLQYQIKDSVIVITPDKPYRRSYQLDYLQTKRAAQSGMTVSTQMASGDSGSSGSGGDGGNGSKVTLTSSDTANDFWDNLVTNIVHIIESSENKEALPGGATAGATPAATAAATPGATAGATPTATAGATPAATAAAPPGAATVATSPKVVLNRATGIVSVLATNRQHKQIQGFIDRVMRIAMRQVFIEATVVSVELSDAFQAGVDWGLLSQKSDNVYTDGGQFMINKRLSDGPRLSLQLNRTKVPFLSGVLGGHDLNATVRLLSQFGNAKVVSTPKVTVLNNQTAVLRVTTNQVYFEIKVTPATVQTTSGGAQVLVPGTSQTLVRTAPVGFIMQVTPQIDDNEMITMNIRPTLQRISQWVDNPDPNMRTNQVVGAAFTPPQVPVVQVQEMDSVLRVSSGQVAVMGGLMQDESNKNMDGIPYLSKLPLFGPLFSFRNDGNIKKELVIFLRPVILNESDDMRTVGIGERHLSRDRPFDNYWGQTGVVLQ
ncbi:MAG: secretin N-terminal domain-containing protein [Magnetococcus sp. XQGC-1]